MSSKNYSDFNDVFDRHFEAVYSYVAYRLSPDHDAAKDLSQEVFLAALKSWKRYRGDGSALTWLRTIARNKVADYFRRSVANAQEGKGTFDHITGDRKSTRTKGNDRTVLVSLVMRQLPGNYGDILEEKYLEGLSVKQIAQRRETTEKAVESVLSRARESFRKIFGRLKNRQEHKT